MGLKGLVILGLVSSTTFAVQQNGDAMIPDECIETSLYEPISVTQSDGVYTQIYTSVYTQVGDSGLKEETYTITETCNEPVCRFPLETAPPPGFTAGAVTCETCNSEGGPLETTLTFPLASMSGYSPVSPPEASPTLGGNGTTPGVDPPNVQAAAPHTAQVPVTAGAAVSFVVFLAAMCML